MSAAEALRAARATGVNIMVDGNDLVLTAPSEPPAAVLGLLSQHKAAIVGLLRRMSRVWSAEDWQAFFDERAGIAEFDGGLPRAQAEAQAFDHCVDEWLSRNPVRSPPERCLGCGGEDHHHDPLLPFGIETTGHAWLHFGCWPPWHAARKSEAVVALTGMGIPAAAEFMEISKEPHGQDLIRPRRLSQAQSS
jgi:hypothetical protein